MRILRLLLLTKLLLICCITNAVADNFTLFEGQGSTVAIVYDAQTLKASGILIQTAAPLRFQFNFEGVDIIKAFPANISTFENFPHPVTLVRKIAKGRQTLAIPGFTHAFFASP